MGAFEDGQSFVAGVLGKLPAEIRAQVKEALDKPEAKDAVTLIGDGVLARTDYSKNMDALKTSQAALAAKEAEVSGKYNELTKWYTVNQAALTEYPTLKAEVDKLRGGGGGDDDDQNKGKGKGTEQPDIRTVAQEVVNNAAPEYIQVSAWLAQKTDLHRAMFGESLDTVALVRNPKLGKEIVGQPGRIYSLEDAYSEAYGEKVRGKNKEAEDKRINDEVEKRLKEERAKGIGHPFPLRGEASPSVLDVLTTKEGSAGHTLDTAVAEYERLQASRVAGS